MDLNTKKFALKREVTLTLSAGHVVVVVVVGCVSMPTPHLSSAALVVGTLPVNNCNHSITV